MSRATDWGLGAWFALSALLQLNDPDPWGWTAFYAAAAAAAAAPPRPAALHAEAATAVAALIGAIAITAGGLGPTTLAELLNVFAMKTLATERWREALGLLLTAGLLLAHWRARRRTQAVG